MDFNHHCLSLQNVRGENEAGDLTSTVFEYKRLIVEKSLLQWMVFFLVIWNLWIQKALPRNIYPPIQFQVEAKIWKVLIKNAPYIFGRKPYNPMSSSGQMNFKTQRYIFNCSSDLKNAIKALHFLQHPVGKRNKRNYKKVMSSTATMILFNVIELYCCIFAGALIRMTYNEMSLFNKMKWLAYIIAGTMMNELQMLFTELIEVAANAIIISKRACRVPDRIDPAA